MLLDDRDRKSVYLSEGLAHGFLALQDDSTVMYLCSAEYAPQREHTISPTDPTLNIRWPSTVFGSELVLSERDRQAPTLNQALATGILPNWTQTQSFVDELRNRLSGDRRD